ncbi:hypothetical protein AB0D57_42065 [Streptomyces sp. NPDC048275]|uniref:hypothetical protein n=1 Tax=Streptomyces sp. NPDC048275 TaxID=3155629 RepID=UPI0033F432F6
MSAARRSLLTATAAGTLLGALWFVPSANATPEEPKQYVSTSNSTAADATTVTSSTTSTAVQAADESSDDQTRLADTGSVNTTPYVVGGTLFLGLGACFVTYSVRRERTAAF